MRRLGVLYGGNQTDSNAKANLAAFTKGLAYLGRIDGRNIRIDYRFSASDIGRMQASAKELINLKPDVIWGQSTPATAALQHETRTIPIVFVMVSDPVGSGFVANLPRPGGNITGFINIEEAASRGERAGRVMGRPATMAQPSNNLTHCDKSRPALRAKMLWIHPAPKRNLLFFQIGTGPGCRTRGRGDCLSAA
jgi:hypothetical protein